jgi:hypothetical protein
LIIKTAFGHGLLDPKAKDNSLVHVAACGPGPKGNEVNIPQASVNVGWAAGWNFKILFFSFEGFRPNLVFWDPVFGSDIDYAVVDQQANPTAQTSANPTSQSSPNPTQSSANSQSSVNPNSQSSANPTVVQSSARTGSSNGNNSSASTLLTHALLVLVCIMALF